MGDFTTQSAISDGSGDYHLNRFRIAFEPPAGVSVGTLVNDLVDGFPLYLRSEFATVEFAGRYHEGNPTLKFHGYAKLLGIDLAGPHDDWVARIWVNRSIGFTAETLKRDLGGEDVGTGLKTIVGASIANVLPIVGALTKIAGGAGVAAGTGLAVHYNREHFLAGRRSWRISDGTVFGLSGNVIVLETVAVERLSSWAYRFANAIVGLESKVPDVWIALLNNFVDMKMLKVVPQVPQPGKSRWKQKRRVDYAQLAFGELGKMLADPEFRDVYKLYPTVFPLPTFWEKYLLSG